MASLITVSWQMVASFAGLSALPIFQLHGQELPLHACAATVGQIAGRLCG